MSTEIEDRLTAALGARAEQVTHADLPPLVVPEATVVPFVRRPVVWGLAAAACAALAVPFVVTNHDRGTDNIAPAPSPTSDVTPAPVASLTGDLDGDGTDETVSIDAHGTLSVVLASSNSGTPLTADAGADGSTLVGLASIDDSGAQSVVTDDRGTGRVFRVTADGLTQVEVEGGQFYYPFTRTDPGMTWWVADITPERPEPGSQLWTAAGIGEGPFWDASSWALNSAGHLQSTAVGDFCAATGATPAPCGGHTGVTVGTGKGQRQVALLPEATAVIGDGGSFPISIDGGGGPGTVRLQGDTVSVDFPGGSPAQQVAIPGQGDLVVYRNLVGGSEVPGILVRRTSGSTETFFVVSWRAGDLVILDVPSGVPTLATHDDQTTWLSANGHLFTRWQDFPSILGKAIVMWSLDGTAGLTSQQVFGPGNDEAICIDSVDPPDYEGC